MMHDFMAFPSMIGVQNSAVKIVKTINYLAKIKRLFEANGGKSDLDGTAGFLASKVCWQIGMPLKQSFSAVGTLQAKVILIKKDVLNDVFWDSMASNRISMNVTETSMLKRREDFPVPYALQILGELLTPPITANFEPSG